MGRSPQRSRGALLIDVVLAAAVAALALLPLLVEFDVAQQRTRRVLERRLMHLRLDLAVQASLRSPESLGAVADGAPSALLGWTRIQHATVEELSLAVPSDRPALTEATETIRRRLWVPVP